MGRNLASLVAGVQRLSVAVAAESGYGLQATDHRFCTRRRSTILRCLSPVAAMPKRAAILSQTITCSVAVPCGASV